ncbi:MAG: hypothetical protein IE917_06975 [Betaproteobacteria bacterium]|nr:hypothetical protein [Betaproteobacteria bacterium]
MECGTHLQRAETKFFMRLPKNFGLDEIDESSLPDDDTRLAFAAFKSALIEVRRLVQVFYNMAMAAVIDNEFASTYLKTKADSIGTNWENNEPAIEEEARRRREEAMDSKEHRDALLEKVARRLINLSESVPELVAHTNDAALRQSAVMLWSASESLLREYFRLAVNNQPDLAVKLFKHDETKRLWNLRDLSLELIEEVQFDLQECMGDVLLEINPMISLKAIKAAFSVISNSDATLTKTLKSTETYSLFALRNLVAHRNGIVDKKFLSETDIAGSAGEKIKLTPAHFETMYVAAKAIGLTLYQYASRKGQPHSNNAQPV